MIFNLKKKLLKLLNFEQQTVLILTKKKLWISYCLNIPLNNLPKF